MRSLRISLQIGFATIALICLFLGQRTGNNLLIGLGLICLGPIVILAGVDAYTRRWLGFRSGRSIPGNYERYTGLSAQLWGVYFVLIGLLVMAFGAGYIVYPGGPEKLWAALLGSRLGLGLALCLIGLLVAMEGFIRVLAGSAGQNIGLPTGVGNCLDRFVGGIVFLVGMAFFGVAAVIVVAPHLLTSLFDALLAPFK